jgi:hypothetical protein
MSAVHHGALSPLRERVYRLFHSKLMNARHMDASTAVISAISPPSVLSVIAGHLEQSIYDTLPISAGGETDAWYARTSREFISALCLNAEVLASLWSLNARSDSDALQRRCGDVFRAFSLDADSLMTPECRERRNRYKAQWDKKHEAKHEDVGFLSNGQFEKSLRVGGV